MLDRQIRIIKTFKVKDYILGNEDGIPKTPKWAEAESTIPARDIKALAREWASKRTMLAAGGLGGWGGACRSATGTQWARLMISLQAMQGLGKPGVNIWGTTQGAPHNSDFMFPGYTEGGMSGYVGGPGGDRSRAGENRPQIIGIVLQCRMTGGTG